MKPSEKYTIQVPKETREIVLFKSFANCNCSGCKGMLISHYRKSYQAYEKINAGNTDFIYLDWEDDCKCNTCSERRGWSEQPKYKIGDKFKYRGDNLMYRISGYGENKTYELQFWNKASKQWITSPFDRSEERMSFLEKVEQEQDQTGEVETEDLGIKPQYPILDI